jgi:hypothetical protein
LTRLAPLGGTLGRGGIPPTPPFRRALASGISAKKSGGYKILSIDLFEILV